MLRNRWSPTSIHIHECIEFILPSPGKRHSSAFISLYGHQIEQSEALCQRLHHWRNWRRGCEKTFPLLSWLLSPKHLLFWDLWDFFFQAKHMPWFDRLTMFILTALSPQSLNMQNVFTAHKSGLAYITCSYAHLSFQSTTVKNVVWTLSCVRLQAIKHR